MSDLIKVFIPIRRKSERVKAKNFRSLFGKPLWRHMIEKLIGSERFRVYVDTDALDILSTVPTLPGHYCTAYSRKKYLLGSGVSVDLLIADFFDRFPGFEDNEPIVQMHVTSPFLQPDTILGAVGMLGKGLKYENGEMVSVVGCTKLQGRLWRPSYENGKDYPLIPMNHDPRRLVPTQDLSPIYLDNSTFYVFTKAGFSKSRSRIGLDPYGFQVPWPECLDIDNEEDWTLCEKLSKVWGREEVI